MRLRAGKTGSGKGAGRMVAQAIATARAAGASGKILVRADSAYGTRAVVRACVRGNAEFSLVMTKNRAIARAIASIPDTAWTPVRYPGAVQDPDTGAWISDAEVAEVTYTAFAATTDRITARLMVRRVKDARYPDALFPVWRYHPFFTNSDPAHRAADIVHRRHAIIETVFADLIDGPLAHLPSGRFGANSAWVLVRRDRPQPAPRRRHPRRPTAHPSPAARPCADRSSPCPPDWPDPPAHPCCTYPAAGPGRRPGSGCGTTPSATARRRRLTPPTAEPGPSTRPVERAGQTSSSARLRHHLWLSVDSAIDHPVAQERAQGRDGRAAPALGDLDLLARARGLGGEALESIQRNVGLGRARSSGGCSGSAR